MSDKEEKAITGYTRNGGFKHDGVRYDDVDPKTGKRQKVTLKESDAKRLEALGRFSSEDEDLATQPSIDLTGIKPPTTPPPTGGDNVK